MRFIPKLFRRRTKKLYQEYYTKEQILQLSDIKLQNPVLKKKMKVLFYVIIGLIITLFLFNNLTIDQGKIKYKYHWVK